MQNGELVRMRRIIVAAVTTVLVVGTSMCALGQGGAIVRIARGSHSRVASDPAGHLHAVCEGEAAGAGTRAILYSKSVNEGQSWTESINISNTPKIASTPDLAVESSGAIDVVWRDTTSGDLNPDVYFTRSTDGGHTWSKAVDISNTPGVCSEPAIAVGPGDSINVVWVDTSLYNNRPDIFYSSSADGGSTWSKYEDISPTPLVSSEPTISVAHDGTVHVAWADTSSGPERPEIYYVQRAAGKWSLPVDVSNSKKISAHPTLACGAKDRVFLCWSDNSQKEHAADIWCAIAGRSGRFAKPINISDTIGVSSQPAMVADSKGRVAIAWSDTSSGINVPDIYARISNDNGDDFSNQIEVAVTPGVSNHPAVALLPTKMVVLWDETASGSTCNVLSTLVSLKGLGTGPVDQVNPTVHRVNR